MHINPAEILVGSDLMSGFLVLLTVNKYPE